MAKFCGKCGSKLNEQGKCPSCKTDENKFFSLNTVKQKPLIGIVAIVLVLAIVVGTVSIVSICFQKDDPKIDNLQLPIVGKFTDKKITDGKSAIKAVQEIADDLGLENAAEELTVKREDTVGELTYYRLQQNYKGIPVYGSDFVVIADENGEAKGVTGNANDINDSISLTPTVTQEQVEESIRAYFGEDAEIAVPKLSENMLVVYNYGDVSNSTVAYKTNANGKIFLINATTSEIIGINSSSSYFNASNEDGSVEFDVYYDMDKNVYVLYDDQRNIIVSSWNGMHHDDINLQSGRKIVEIRMAQGLDYAIRSNDSIFSDVETMLYTWGIKTYDFFDSRFESGAMYDRIYLFYDDGIDSGENAYGGISEENKKYGYITVGTAFELTATDVLAHEFAHVISSYIVEWDDGGSLSSEERQIETGAINEGISDLFGVLVDADIKKTVPDWVLTLGGAGRSIDNPESLGGIRHISQISENMGSHARSTIVSHAAYLMTQTNSSGTVLTTEQLAHLWYNTLFTLPSNCTFNALRQNMLMVAESMDYTNEQIACITAAFDAVGIDGMDGGSTAWENYSNKDLTMQVYGINMELYDDYTIDIIKYGDDRSENKHIVVTDTNPVPLKVSGGSDYTITIRDRKDTTKIVTKNIHIISDDDADQTIQFATNFGNIGSTEIPDASTSDERDIVLVLDNSGSMSGTPIEETRKASENFVKTVLQQDASIGIVAFEDEANMLSNFSMDEAQLMSALGNLYANGGTNTLAGLTMAGEMLEQSNAKNKIIVLMSDGRPSNTQSELAECAKELRKKGIIIYTLGFFDQVGDDNKAAAQSIMETIADDGRHYEVEDVDNLVFFFGDIADQISGQQYIYIRIACPVEVTVEYDGETLCSDANALNTRTNFGTLTFEERTDGERVKILRLKQGTEYDIRIEGTGEGRMNYTIGLMDENGEYSDMRKFYNVKITDKTVINTVASESRNTVLEVDEDGDGKLDIQYKAEENSRGEIVKANYTVWIIPSVILILIAAITLVVLKKKNILVKKG